jgi:hypothetical protein
MLNIRLPTINGNSTVNPRYETKCNHGNGKKKQALMLIIRPDIKKHADELRVADGSVLGFRSL